MDQNIPNTTLTWGASPTTFLFGRAGKPVEQGCSWGVDLGIFGAISGPRAPGTPRGANKLPINGGITQSIPTMAFPTGAPPATFFLGRAGKPVEQGYSWGSILAFLTPFRAQGTPQGANKLPRNGAINQ